MRISRLRQIVRQFPENGLKLLLETPANVRELLALADESVVDVIEHGQLFQRFTPLLQPLFLNLSNILPEQLTTKGGAFAWVLQLIRARQENLNEFRRLLKRAVANLEALPAQERSRWLELLS